VIGRPIPGQPDPAASPRRRLFSSPTLFSASLGIGIESFGDVRGRDPGDAAVFGLLAGLFRIAIMRARRCAKHYWRGRAVAPLTSRALRRACRRAMALLTPQVMSSGHGALHFT